MFQIEKDVPLPEARQPASSYPFRLMEVGDSFMVTDEEVAKRARASAYMTSKRMGAKFACRTVADGWRFWRVA
jgi:hypothetical protein